MKVKSNDTAVRALEVLKLLSYDELTQEQIIDLIFKAKKSEYELRTDSLYKYLNTFKLHGIDVQKNKGKYSLKSSLLKIVLTEKDIEAIKFLYAYSKEVCSEEIFLQFEILLQNLLKNKNVNFKLEDIDTKTYLRKIKLKVNKENIQKFYILCKEEQRISFDYFNKDLNKIQTFVVEPKEVIVKPTGEILRAFNPEVAEIQDFRIEDINEVKQLPVRVKSVNVKNSVTFKLKGRLGLTYELKKGERLISKEDDMLVISNSEEDKDELLKRLLRYGVSCEILFPKTFKLKFLKTLQKIKSFYE